MINLGLRSKYGIRHGEELRKKRRAHARDMAGIEAESSMAELERGEQGETRRKRMEEVGLGERLGRTQAGETRRQAMIETGEETQHLREYGPEGTAGQRLSWVKEQAAKEQATKDFTIRASGILGGYITPTESGDMLDKRLRPAFMRAQAEAMEDPAGALKRLKSAVSFLEGQGTGSVGKKEIGGDIKEQAPKLSEKSIFEQIPNLSMEDINLMLASNAITPEKAQELREEILLRQRLAPFMPEETIAPQTRGTTYYDLSHGRQRLGEMR